MPITRADDARIWQLPGTTFTAVASPSRGQSQDVSVWRLTMAAGTAPTVHSVTRTEVFAVIGGCGQIAIGDAAAVTVGIGDAIVVPPDTPFELGTGADPLEAIVCLTAGGQAAMPGAAPFTPEWAR
jgi:mannose-6-phosphate isomerase-like protein (cupin superfamily)